MRFEWDPDKALTNQRKHGVSFELAVRVFDDPYALSDFDRIEDGEARWRAIGLVEATSVLVVAHVFRNVEEENDSVRIISARRATRQERTRYEQERLRHLRA